MSLFCCTGLYLFSMDHEGNCMNKIHGFDGEVKSKFNETMADLFAKVFGTCQCFEQENICHPWRFVQQWWCQAIRYQSHQWPLSRAQLRKGSMLKVSVTQFAMVWEEDDCLEHVPTFWFWNWGQILDIWAVHEGALLREAHDQAVWSMIWSHNWELDGDWWWWWLH
jgi:hypothetical protein